MNAEETPRTHAAIMLASDADGAKEVCQLCEELERENARLQAECYQWERTARRLASKCGWENSDFLEPDSLG
jgi:hypothetical protein